MRAAMNYRAVCGALLTLAVAACSRFDPGATEMHWARTALERNDRLEVVATDERAKTFTVRLKDSGQLRVLRIDQIVAGPTHAAAAMPSATAVSSTEKATTPDSVPPPAAIAVGAADPTRHSETEQAADRAQGPAPSRTTAAAANERAAADTTSQFPRSEGVASANPGHVLAAGPGYTIQAGDSRVAATGRREPAATVRQPVERRHEPIVCQGERFLQIDNRNLEFDGDAVAAQDGCEIHITNSRIIAKGVGVMARRANVHIENSQIEGDSGSIDAAQGAQIYCASSTFTGLRRRMDDAAFHDLGGNVWN